MWQTCPNYEVRKIKLFLCDIGCVLILGIEDRYYFLIILVKKKKKKNFLIIWTVIDNTFDNVNVKNKLDS